ncbi:hypothetical protein SAY87_003135 [Trapa incisa]|uniref:Adaptor AP-1 19 kDa protein n=1 Tax=Trapa incisa TaxID=236973 RepID=A0AAN7KIN4_9MYRT|nr:hypothetical protein SAY87_003135 [Trapa incisa]
MTKKKLVLQGFGCEYYLMGGFKRNILFLWPKINGIGLNNGPSIAVVRPIKRAARAGPVALRRSNSPSGYKTPSLPSEICEKRIGRGLNLRSVPDLYRSTAMIHFVLLISRQGKVRLTKWYSPYSQKERTKVIRELSSVILTRGPKLCNFVEWRGLKVVYRRKVQAALLSVSTIILYLYASLYFCMCIDQDDNELEVLEIIHHYVEILDRYFGSVCELDLIFNFHKAYYILDELLLAGELQESSKKTVARLIAAQDALVETAKEEASSISNIIAQATK